MKTGSVRVIFFQFFLPALLLSVTFPAWAQDEAPSGWTIPGQGVSSLTVNPSDGSLWMFCHQTMNLVALNTSDGSAIIDVPLAIRPTAMAFTPDGSMGFLVGEPDNDQIYDKGLVQAFNPFDGSVIGELELEGSCNAVYVVDNLTVYVACGMQYAYQGTLYKLALTKTGSGNVEFTVDSQAVCGKIPWAIAIYNDVLYVTDLELQWALQADGSMGPPYGAWVWAYNPGDLTSLDKTWVGINPTHLAVLDAGLLVGCSGNKMGEGDLLEPAISFIESPGVSDPIYIESSGASDMDTSPDGTWAVVSLADWGPPACNSALAIVQQMMPGVCDDIRRWVYTGDIAYIKIGMDAPEVSTVEIFPDSFVRAVAISIDGATVYVLDGMDDSIIPVPSIYSMPEASDEESDEPQ